ncbi:unnamed protein product [Linum tenue]|uniref:F-box domain-containing protein n=1 Tax=Linum tenue TaxID=586396 RepID=A0AAV0PCP1_9ROSI|nr:unnamed protein product [Linum tenue]
MVWAVRGSGSRGGEDGEDRISQLPEEIIHAILNRLESPEKAAGTSVLSRRWLQLWRRYPFFESPLSKSNTKFRSFVASSSRKLLFSSSSNDHSWCAAIQDFRISVQDDGFEKEDLDRLLSLIADHADRLLLSLLSPVKFVLRVDPRRTRPSYSLLRVPNWSRTKSITLAGCDLSNNRSNNGLASLPNLESLRLEVVDLSERLLHCFLDNAPRLVELELWGVYGIDRLEVVSSPRLRSLRLSCIYRSKNRCQRMRSLRISSPELETLLMSSGLEELEIDAPDLVSLSWTVLPDDPVTKVNLVNLASTCRSEIRVCSPAITFSPRWLTASFSSAFSQFHRLDLVLGFPIYLARREQVTYLLTPIFNPKNYLSVSPFIQ